MKLIMFDVDGTLTDTCEAEVRLYVPAVREALGIAEIDTDWSTYKNYTDPGVTSEVVERAWGRQATPEELARVCARWVELVDEDFAKNPDACRAIPGARRIIEAVRRRTDCAISIATGCWWELAERKLRTAGIPFDGIPFASGSDASERREIMALSRDRAESYYGVGAFERIVYVGDGVWDARTSATMGWPFIGVAESEKAQRLREEGVERIVRNYEDVDAFLELIDRVTAA